LACLNYPTPKKNNLFLYRIDFLMLYLFDIL
jgi:hypothetical protein